jgi:hypothetical protein
MTDRITPLLEELPQVPTDTETLVRANAAVQLIGGLMLATGRFSRPAALVLAGSLVPTTVAGHPFWSNDDPVARNNNQVHFLKNLGLAGGLLLAAADTEGSRVWCAPATGSATHDARCSAPSVPRSGRPGSPCARPRPPAACPADPRTATPHAAPPPAKAANHLNRPRGVNAAEMSKTCVGSDTVA